MFSTTLVSAGGLLLAAGMASAQTFTDCNPLEKTCPCDAGLGSTITTDFTKGKSSDWTLAAGTTLTYSPTDGAQFSITSTQAPTIESNKFIMFGKVSVVMKAAPGAGIVSSVVLESDDLDEIDWEWIGSLNTEVQTNFFGKGNTTTYDRGKTLTMADAVGSFHEYTVDWTADSIKWEIDGVVVRTVTYNDPIALYGKNFPQTPMSIKLGNWIGCLDAAAAADEKTKWTCEWAGGPKSGNGPFVMSVKSVTIQDYGAGGEYCYSDKSGSWQSITSNGKSSSGGSSSKSSSASASSTATAKGSSSTKAGSSTASSSGSSASGSTSVGSSDSSATTLTSTVSAATGTAIVAAAATTATTSPSAQTTSSGAQTMKPKHKYGVLDLSVMGLGLVLGYFVM